MKKMTMLCALALLCLSFGRVTARASDTAQAGMHHTAAENYYIDASGGLYKWTGEQVPLPGRAVDVSSSGAYARVSAVVLEDGSLYTWGHNRDGQLGLGDTTDRDAPTRVPGLSNVVSVSVGQGISSAAVTSDGSVYTWGHVYTGDDAQYQAIFKSVTTPQRAKGIENAVGVSTGGENFAALCADGSVYTWGIDNDGGNGYGVQRNSAVPVKLSLPPVRAVSRARWGSAAVTTDGKLYTWGRNDSHVLGRRTPNDEVDGHFSPDGDATPGLVSIEPVVSVCLGNWFYCEALTDSGTVYHWGSTQRDDKERAPKTDSDVPIKLAEGTSFVQLFLGDGKSAGVTLDGKLYTWGWNENGALGNGVKDVYCAYPTLAKDNAAVPGILPAGSLDVLTAQKTRNYTAGTFSDVNEDSWYGANRTKTLAEAYEYGFVNGTGDGRFTPESPLRVSEAIRLACSLQDRYAGGSGTFSGGSPWYRPYVHHAVTLDICRPGDFADYDAYITRAQMAYLFARALPQSAYPEIKEVSSLPDVAADTPHAAEIFKLYRAGVLTGSDAAGTFQPDREITRAEAVAVYLRLADPKMRIGESCTG